MSFEYLPTGNSTPKTSKNKNIDEIDVQSEFDERKVEKILESRVKTDGQIEYYVKWKNAGYHLSSWELPENLDKKKVKAFERSKFSKEVKCDLFLSSSALPTTPKRRRSKRFRTTRSSLNNNDRSLGDDCFQDSIEDTHDSLKCSFEQPTASDKKMVKISNDDPDIVDLAKVKLECYQNGFDRGYRFKEIVGVTNDNSRAKYPTDDKILFIVTWKDKHTKPELIGNSILREKCPQEVIEFYNSRLYFPK